MSRKTRQQLADEAYAKTQRPEYLAGQVELDGSVIGEAEAEPMAETIPGECPGCHQNMTLAHGWTCMAGTRGGTASLQCGNCGTVAHVSPEAADDLQQQL